MARPSLLLPLALTAALASAVAGARSLSPAASPAAAAPVQKPWEPPQGATAQPPRSPSGLGTGSSRATLVSVGDGDTIRVRQGERLITVRLACIDAPEMAQHPWGARSRASLQQRLPPGTPLILVVKETDRYGRSVAEVISEISINLVLVEDGQAFAYRRYLHHCDAREYLDAEQRASRHRYGVWQQPGGIQRPWDFRQARRGAVIPDGSTPGGHRYRCRQIGSYARAQELLRQGHSYLDGNGDGEACESLRR